MSVIEDPVEAGRFVKVNQGGGLYVNKGLTLFDTAGGAFSVAGQTSSVVAASLGANVTLMAARFALASTRKAYITRLRLLFTPATLGTSALVAGTLGLQKFTTATPTGGTARTSARKNANTGSATDMTDIRDSNAALTVTSVVFSDIISSSLIPLFVASGGAVEWIVDMDDIYSEPFQLNAGDGVCLRTQVACPATQTWMYSYTIHWFEK
jgi:hypothetical protein